MVAAHAVNGDPNTRQSWQHRELGRQCAHEEGKQATGDEAGVKNIVGLLVSMRVWRTSTVSDEARRCKRATPPKPPNQTRVGPNKNAQPRKPGLGLKTYKTLPRKRRYEWAVSNLPIRRTSQRGLAINSGVSLGFEHLAAPVKPSRADVMAQMHFTGGGLNRDARGHQGIVRAVHAALGRRLLVLLNGHGELLIGPGVA